MSRRLRAISGKPRRKPGLFLALSSCYPMQTSHPNPCHVEG